MPGAALSSHASHGKPASVRTRDATSCQCGSAVSPRVSTAQRGSKPRGSRWDACGNSVLEQSLDVFEYLVVAFFRGAYRRIGGRQVAQREPRDLRDLAGRIGHDRVITRYRAAAHGGRNEIGFDVRGIAVDDAH